MAPPIAIQYFPLAADRAVEVALVPKRAAHHERANRLFSMGDHDQSPFLGDAPPGRHRDHKNRQHQ